MWRRARIGPKRIRDYAIIESRVLCSCANPDALFFPGLCLMSCFKDGFFNGLVNISKVIMKAGGRNIAYFNEFYNDFLGGFQNQFVCFGSHMTSFADVLMPLSGMRFSIAYTKSLVDTQSLT